MLRTGAQASDMIFDIWEISGGSPFQSFQSFHRFAHIA
jgi:hypothetical protein